MPPTPTPLLWTVLAALPLIVGGCGGGDSTDDATAPASTEATDEAWGDESGDAENVNCYGLPREEPLAFFEPDLGFLRDLEGQRQLLDCLGRDAVHLSYRLRMVQDGAESSVRCELDLARDGGLATQRGTLETDGKSIMFALNATTARWTAADGTAHERPRGEALAFFAVDGIDAETQLATSHTGVLVGVVGLATALRSQLVGNPDAWTFTAEGDALRAVLPRLSLARIDPDLVAESVSLRLSEGAVPLECTMRFVGKDFTSDFEMTIR